MSKHPVQRSRKRVATPSGQRGATLIIGLIMIVLISLVVVNAFTLSSANLKSVGNMQVRDEAVAAANQSVEQLISGPFTNALGTITYAIDINKDGTNDYAVVVGTPTCIRANRASSASPSDVELPPEMSTGANWNTDWDIPATVTDNHNSGARAVVRQGVRVLLTQAQKDDKCP